MYADTVVGPKLRRFSTNDARIGPVSCTVTNTARFTVSLRRQIRNDCDEKIYIVLLLDSLLMQIGSVAFGTAYNKIVSVSDAALLFRHFVQWYQELYPNGEAV